MGDKQIILSPEELEDLKDEIKFRTKVVVQLKALVDVPNKVTKLEVHSGIHWVLLLGLVGGIVTLAFRVLAR